MRETFTAIFFVVTAILLVCAVVSLHSPKKMGRYVSFLLISLIFPVLGNLIITATTQEAAAIAGYYIYAIGMDAVALTLLLFAMAYGNIKWTSQWLKFSVYGILTLDILIYALHPLIGQPITVEHLVQNGDDFFRLLPYTGQTFHRLLVYGFFITIIGIFLYKSLRSPKVYAEKYYVILLLLLISAIWHTYSIFSDAHINQSMIGVGLFGVSIFFFALYYRPLKLLDRLLSNVAAQMHEALFFFDSIGRCVWINKQAQDLLHITEEQADLAPSLLTQKYSCYNHEELDFEKKTTLKESTGFKYYILKKKSIYDKKQQQVGSLLNIIDNTEDEIKHQIKIHNNTHDKLTNLYTKVHLYERIEETLHQKKGIPYIVAIVDIKNFKIVNDIFGTETGDLVLNRVALWIKSNANENWLYGRIAGDTFGCCMPESDFKEKILERLLNNFTVKNGNLDHHILMHIGIYKVTEEDKDVSVMFDRAKLALSTIKDNYNQHIARYNSSMRDQVLWEQKITSQLNQAIEERQLCPYLQPIVNLSGEVIGAEALVRWIHPEKGFLSPLEFIPIFEKNGLIANTDLYIWRCACEIIAEWEKQGKDLFISVNISPKDFYFIDVFEEIEKLTQEFNISPAHLRIEITENVMMSEAENCIHILNKFRDAGYQVEMDDFGSGFSSLNQLKDMPLDVIKIDMKFLSKSANTQKAETIMMNILRMSDDLGLSSLTEGVETELQFHKLSQMGCKLFQGYYFAKPMPVDEFDRQYA